MGFFDIVFWIVVFWIVVFGLVYGYDKSNASKKNTAIDMEVDLLKDFTTTQKINDKYGNASIAIDENKKKIAFIRYQKDSKKALVEVMSYKDILSSEIFEDGKTVTETSRKSQAAGALIGGLALGGVGVIVGGLSGKTTSTTQITRIDLRVTVNNTHNPIHDLTLKNINEARHWHGLLSVLMKRADKEDKAVICESPSTQEIRTPSPSVADELKKLAELKDQGILTEEEFTDQKAKLLALHF